MSFILKHSHNDFHVEEILTLDIEKQKDTYSIYRIVKKGTNTLDVIDDIAKRLRIPKKHIGYGGLKDKQAISTQYISIPDGQSINYSAKNYTLDFIGWSKSPVSRSVLRGNKFSTVIRNIDTKEIATAIKQIELIKRCGFVNYYDEQRLASARHKEGFFARSVILEHWQEAFKLLFAYSSKHDDQKTRRFRKCVQQNWNKWENCIPFATTHWERRVLEYISKHHKRFKKSLELVDKEFLFLLATAYQSYLWNKVAVEWLEKFLPKRNFFNTNTKFGKLLFPKNDGDEICKYIDIEIPSLSPKMTLDEPWNSLYEKVLNEEGIHSKSNFKSKLTGLYFRSHRRKLFVLPENFSYSIADDEIFDGKKKLTINTFLPKGSFLTMIVRQIFLK